MGTRACTAVVRALIDHPSLTELHLDATNLCNTAFSRTETFDGSALDEIGALLARNRRLAELHLANNDVTPYGARAIAAGLAANVALRTLDLGNEAAHARGAIGSEGAAHLAQALRANSSLTELSLPGQLLSEADAELLASAGGGRCGVLTEQARGYRTAADLAAHCR